MFVAITCPSHFRVLHCEVAHLAVCDLLEKVAHDSIILHLANVVDSNVELVALFDERVR